MKKGRIRFLAEGEAPPRPGWTRLLPAAWREYYTRSRSPYHIEEQAGVWEGILHTRKEGITGDGWRQNATALLDEMRQNGVGIVMPPAEGEFPQEGLPFAEGRKITSVFAFAGAAEALRRKGTEPAQASYLIAGGEPWLWEQAFSSMGNEVNRLSIYTEQKRAAEAVAERLYEECGLLVEVFSSPKNPAFAKADAILSCGLEQRSYEHILKQGCFWLDLAGNRPALRRLVRLRPDITAAEGFYFHTATEEGQTEGREAEADAYISCPVFRQCWKQDNNSGVEAFGELSAMGYRVSGFSALGKRVKVSKR